MRPVITPFIATFRSVVLCVLALGASTLSVLAQANERLIAPVPKGYNAGVEQPAPIGTTRHMVPARETLDNWTESVAVQTYPGLGDIKPAEFQSGIDRVFTQYCPGSTSSKVKEGLESGYPTLIWLMQCARHPRTGKPENIWTKAIQGRDGLYVVQAAYRYEVAAAARDELLRYLDSVTVCDTRLPDRPCR